jgi:hypothetical protein
MVLAFDSMAQGTPTAQVEVRFEHPENFHDASLDSQVTSVAPTRR